MGLRNRRGVGNDQACEMGAASAESLQQMLEVAVVIRILQGSIAMCVRVKSGLSLNSKDFRDLLI
jgi:hypothetical protein